MIRVDSYRSVTVSAESAIHSYSICLHVSAHSVSQVCSPCNREIIICTSDDDVQNAFCTSAVFPVLTVNRS